MLFSSEPSLFKLFHQSALGTIISHNETTTAINLLVNLHK